MLSLIDWPTTSGHATAPEKVAQLRFALSHFGYRRLIETGIYGGSGSGLACLDLLDSYHVCDCQQGNLEAVAATVERDAPGVMVATYLGDSAERIADVLANLSGPAVFWLDAHKIAQDGDTMPDFPTLRELELIAADPRPHVVLVDDIDQFDDGDPDYIVGAPKPVHFRAWLDDIGRWTMHQPDSIMRLVPIT